MGGMGTFASAVLMASDSRVIPAAKGFSGSEELSSYRTWRFSSCMTRCQLPAIHKPVVLNEQERETSPFRT